MSNSSIFLGTENETNRRILIRVRPVLASIVEVHMHLPRIGMTELPDLRILLLTVRKPQLCRRCLHNVRIGQVKSAHLKKVAATKTSAEFGH